MLPFPNDHFTVADDATATGRRVDLAPDTTPANVHGVHVDPTELNRNDGFSPGSFWDIERTRRLPDSSDSYLVVWDFGTDAPPPGNVPNRTGDDPHGMGRDQVEVLTVASTFLDEGTLVDTCDGGPCQTLDGAG